MIKPRDFLYNAECKLRGLSSSEADESIRRATASFYGVLGSSELPNLSFITRSNRRLVSF